MHDQSADAAAFRLLRKQHGFGRVSQLIELGLSHTQIALRVRKGLLAREAHALVALPDAEDTLQSRTMRAVLMAGEGAAACLWTAAALHGLDAPPDEQTHVVVEGSRKRSPTAKIYFHRTRYLPHEHITKISSIPTTTVPRTVVDCASLLDRWTAMQLLDSCNASGTLWRAIHLTAIELSNGRAGVRAIADATAPDGPARMRSALERHAAEALHSRGVPSGEWNVVVHDARGRVREVDLCYRAHKLIIEFDGLRFHNRRATFRRDRATDRRLQLGGWRILRFTWQDVVYRPAAMAHEIMRALGDQ